MPRTAREKTNDSIFHIMVRSLDEVDLFKDDLDKKMYIEYVKKYLAIFKFKVYGYCLMDNHVHMIIDINGADISMVMHGINYSYVIYFNGKHHRRGHLLEDRFRSKIVKSDGYLIALSAYVHNNPTKIPGYEKHPEKYPFSSLSVYLGLEKDQNKLIEDSFVLSLFGKNTKTAIKKYMRLVFRSDYEAMRQEAEFTNEGTEYRSQRHILARNTNPEKIIEFIASKLGLTQIKIHQKGGRCDELTEAKALFALFMRGYCNARCADICRILGSISQGRASTLCSYGMKLMDTEKYRIIAEEFLNQEAS